MQISVIGEVHNKNVTITLFYKQDVYSNNKYKFNPFSSMKGVKFLRDTESNRSIFF